MRQGVLFVLVLTSLFFASYFYFSVISPVFALKPEVEAPKGSQIEDSHIIYFLNEVEAYRLHENPLNSEPAVIEMHLDGKIERFAVENFTYIKTTAEPDVLIYTSKKDFLMLLSESDLKKELNKMSTEGKIKIESLNDDKSLALKGYKVIFDSFSANDITGNVVLPITNSFNMLFLLLAFALINVVKEKI